MASVLSCEPALNEESTEVCNRLEADENLDVATRTKVTMLPSSEAMQIPATEEVASVDDANLVEEPAVGLLISNRCQHLIGESRGDTEAHVVTAIAEDHCLDALRDTCMGLPGGKKAVADRASEQRWSNDLPRNCTCSQAAMMTASLPPSCDPMSMAVSGVVISLPLASPRRDRI